MLEQAGTCAPKNVLFTAHLYAQRTALEVYSSYTKYSYGIPTAFHTLISFEGELKRQATLNPV